jgi:hypothetical protein
MSVYGLLTKEKEGKAKLCTAFWAGLNMKMSCGTSGKKWKKKKWKVGKLKLQ